MLDTIDRIQANSISTFVLAALDKCVTVFDSFMEHLSAEELYNQRHSAAYTIQTAYRKHIIRKYLHGRKQVVTVDGWHMNVLS